MPHAPIVVECPQLPAEKERPYLSLSSLAIQA